MAASSPSSRCAESPRTTAAFGPCGSNISTSKKVTSAALLGFDQTTAEVLVSLITGAITPDAGEVMVFGNSTRDILDGDAWLQGLDRFGILSERAVLLDQLTAEQNLAVPFSLDVHDMGEELQGQVRRLAEEVGLSADELRAPAGSLGPTARQRIRLGRALALTPSVFLAEHPNASLDATDISSLALTSRGS